MGFLEDVIERKREEVAARKKVLPPGALAPHPDVPTYRFLDSLIRPGVRLICEVKRKSPSEGALASDDDVIRRVHRYKEGGAAAISVLTDEEAFGGTLDDLAKIRDEVPLPLLRKDFLVDEYQLMEAASVGANAALLIVAALDQPALVDLVAAARELGVEPLVEVHDEPEVERAVASGARVIGVNARNLSTLEVDLSVTKRVLPTIPEDRVAVAESGITSYFDIQELGEAGARAFLVGSALMKSDDILGAMQGLQGFF